MDVCGDKIIVGSTSGVLSSWDFEGNKIGSVQVGLEQADLIRGIQSVDPVNGIVLTAQQNGSVQKKTKEKNERGKENERER